MATRYSYDGPVMFFSDCIARHWKGSTVAESKEKARSNLAYQYKKEHNLVPSAKVTLPGKITEG